MQAAASVRVLPCFHSTVFCVSLTLVATAAAILGKRPREEEWPTGDGRAHMDGEPGKKRRKLTLPAKEHPDINFLGMGRPLVADAPFERFIVGFHAGLLIGPRGSTQKELESASGARILV